MDVTEDEEEEIKLEINVLKKYSREFYNFKAIRNCDILMKIGMTY